GSRDGWWKRETGSVTKKQGKQIDDRSHSDEPEVPTSGDIPNTSALKTTARARGLSAATWVLILPVLCIVT
ncbi:hypothetical protein LSAT2_005990, partial [Lamellibrachia satsuma]